VSVPCIDQWAHWIG